MKFYNIYINFICLAFILLLPAELSFAQENTVPPDKLIIAVPADTAQNPVPAGQDTSAVSAPDTAANIHSPKGAMLRSLALPGWGQIYNRHYIKAAVIGGGEIGLLISILVQHDRFKDARKNGFSEAADFYKNDRNRLTWYLGFSILYSMADAYVDGHLYEFDLDRELALGFDGRQVILSVNW